MNLHIHKIGDTAPTEYDVLIGPDVEPTWRGGGRAKGRLVILVDTPARPSRMQVLIYRYKKCTVIFNGFSR
ncbi:hypothetical protein [Rhizobium etli]|uniref:hypothetical protein n=1 Tax=Rhizobium etli TaxID=29449 RepID=UPI000A3263DE|nr:hypothetical protein [Rhizobium etli]